MSAKKKLSLGVASAALGLALVGGGTWAAFNDVERLSNTFAAGTLNLEVVDVDGGETEFHLQNLKPGDTMERSFKLENRGSLAIKEVLMNTHAFNFQNAEYNEFVHRHGMPDNNMKQFLKQFQVEILLTGVENQNAQPRRNFEIIKPEDNKTLWDLTKMKNINLTPENVDGQWTGIPLDPLDDEVVYIKITMKDDQEKVKRGPAKGEYKQNVYQGDSVDFKFILEATQWDGLNTDQTNENGYLHINERANSN